MGRYLTVLAVLAVLAVAGSGYFMTTGHGGFIERVVAAANDRGGGDPGDEFDDEDVPKHRSARRSPGLESAHRRLKESRKWAEYYDQLYGRDDSSGRSFRYCFGQVCKKKPRRDRGDVDDESDEE